MSKSARVIVAVSGGPDSMALLDLFNNHLERMPEVDYTQKELAVCHVNYHHRPTADRDENIVKEYCKANNIPFHKLDVYEPEEKCNFQDWARQQRYNFFAETAKLYNADTLYIAHNLDDMLETYIMQKERNSIPATWGIALNTQGYGFRHIERPLLYKEKRELQNYCDKYNVAYGIDESNLTDEYRRNQIRHTVIDFMSYEDKQGMLKEIEQRNKQKKENHAKWGDIAFSECNRFPWGLVNDSSTNECLETLEWYLHFSTHQHYGKGMVSNIIKKLQDTGYAEFGDYCIQLLEGTEEYFVKVYGMEKPITPVVIDRLPYSTEYEKYDQMLVMKTKQNITIDKVMKGMEEVTNFENRKKLVISPDEMPLTLRTYNTDDKIKMRYGTKKISHIVRDKKVPKYMRGNIFVILNNKDEVIYSNISGCDKDHFDWIVGKMLCEVSW